MVETMRIVPGRIPFTWRELVIAGAIAACAPAMTASAQPAAAAPGSIEWSIERDGTSPDASKVQLQIDSRWGENSRSTGGNERPIGELQGLSAGEVTGPDTPVRFALVRDAGRLDCFSANDLVNLSIHGVSGDYVRRLQESGMAHVSADQLVRLRLAGFEPK